MIRLLRNLHHQSKETHEAIQALESWTSSCDKLRTAEMELINREIAVQTKMDLFDQTEWIRISPTPVV